MTSFACGFLVNDIEAWEVNPTTRCLVAPRLTEELTQVAEWHANHGDRLFKRLNPRFESRYEGVPKLSDSQLKIAVKLEHELDHLQRHLSTSLGFLLHLIKSRMVDLFLERLDNTVTDRDGMLPWYPANESLTAFDQKPDELSKNRRLYLGYRSLWALLTCESLSPVCPTRTQAEHALAVIVEDLFPRIGYKTDGSSLNVADSDDDSRGETRLEFPIFSDGGKEEKFGAQGLLEAFAVCREMSQMRFANRSPLRDLSQWKVSIYTSAMRIWQNVFRLPRVSLGKLGSQWTEVGVSNQDAFPLEFYAAADLALWQPILPGVSSTKAKFGWRDIHPGWRFFRILEYLSKFRKTWLSPVHLDAKTDKWLLDFQSEVCEALRWPTPSQLASDMFGFLKNGYDSSGFGKLLIADDQGRVAASLNFLNTRLEYPARFALGFPASYGASVNWFSCIVGTDSTGKKVKRNIVADEKQEAAWVGKGYQLPVAFAILETVELYGERLNTNPSQLSDSDRLRFFTYGRFLESSFATYAERHYGIKNPLFGRAKDFKL